MYDWKNRPTSDMHWTTYGNKRINICTIDADAGLYRVSPDYIIFRRTINSFSEKLSLNGIKVNKTISRRLEDGVRAFDVTIFQYPCLGRVEYNTSTKNVYEGILMFQISSTLNEFTQFMEYFSNQIEDKYSKGMFTLNYEEDEYNSYPADHYIIYSSKNNKRIGEIYLYMDVKEYDKSTDRGKFLFHVMYRNIEAPSFKERMQDYY